MAATPHVSIAAETVFHVAGFPVTNALITTWAVMAFLTIISLAITSNLKRKPGKIQAAAELLIGGLYNFFTNLGGHHGKKFFPLIGSLFLFVVISNWAGLLPGVGTIGFYETDAEHASSQSSVIIATTAADQEMTKTTVIGSNSETADHETSAEVKPEATAVEEEHAEKEAVHKKFVPLFRGPTADLNTTLALALVAFGAIQFFGLSIVGAGYLKKFVDLRSPIFFFVGILEIVSDISKILSFAFRLFGNIFAGEVLLAVMAFLLPFLLPVPFYAMELFVGVIQGLVFAMLTSVFINIAVSHAHEEHANQAHA